jgi:hypothetical protein
LCCFQKVFRHISKEVCGCDGSLCQIVSERRFFPQTGSAMVLYCRPNRQMRLSSRFRVGNVNWPVVVT